MDIAKRFSENPLLRPSDLQPGIEGMEITCLLNPGVFRMNGKTWLLLRVAERPKQVEGKISFPVYSESGKIEVLVFDKDDPQLDASDPRVIKYRGGQNYLTTLSYLRLVVSDDGVHFREDPRLSANIWRRLSRIIWYRRLPRGDDGRWLLPYLYNGITSCGRCWPDCYK